MPSHHLLYFCPISIGGVARNAIEQASEIAKRGVDVTLLVTADFPGKDEDHPGVAFAKILLSAPHSGSHGRFVSRLLLAASILYNHVILARWISRHQFRHVMLASYSEYLAPFYAWLLCRLSRQGTIFGANVLDPVRDHVVGPLWWHRWSIAEGYLYLSEAFVHKMITLDTVRPMPGLTTTVVPHGPYFFPPAQRSRLEAREELGIPRDAFVFLAFGHLRDNKNLLLALEALKTVPEAFLLVAGSEAAPGQTQSDAYQTRGRELGVDERVRWMIRYIPDPEVADIFGMADCLLMTYSASFRSASGVMHAATPFRLPVLVSAGDSPLLEIVRKYRFGHIVEPDSAAAIVEGMKLAMGSPTDALWDDFTSEHSYKEAAAIICDRIFKQGGPAASEPSLR
jgi:glycosyltransferase involved in cell wall biosynthesis